MRFNSSSLPVLFALVAGCNMGEVDPSASHRADASDAQSHAVMDSTDGRDGAFDDGATDSRATVADTGGVAIPGYHMTLPPGGREGGIPNWWVHWFGVDTASVALGQEFWAFFSFEVDSDSDIPCNFEPTFNLHVTPSNPAWSGIAVSPIRFELVDGRLSLSTQGGGVFDPNQYGTGVPGYHDVTQTHLPASPPAWHRNVRYDVTIHAIVSPDPRVGYLGAWYSARDGSMATPAELANVHTPTMYNNDPGPLSLYFGFYTRGSPQVSCNDGKTFKLTVWLPRMGPTPAAAAMHTPARATEWGALENDPTVVTSVPPLYGSDFAYPAETGL
jgi:hypothetical protein